MSTYSFVKTTHKILIWIVLGLAIVALGAELMPEVKAKLIVVPTLILVIALIALELQSNKRKVQT